MGLWLKNLQEYAIGDPAQLLKIGCDRINHQYEQKHIAPDADNGFPKTILFGNGKDYRKNDRTKKEKKPNSKIKRRLVRKKRVQYPECGFIAFFKRKMVQYS